MDLPTVFEELLIENNIKVDRIEFSKDQQNAIDIFNTGQLLFVHGSAGVGKSALIKEFRRLANKAKKIIAITATTGVASYSINGMTINSFLGIGTAKDDSNGLLRKLRYRKDVVDRISQTEILVIDEISMMSAAVFEKIDDICRIIRKRRKEPFGGMQVVIVGDLLQLEFIKDRENPDTRLIFESNVFKQFIMINLKKNFRQEGDIVYSEILSRMRIGESTIKDIDTLMTRKIDANDIESKSIQIVVTNKKADVINKKFMDEIDGKVYTFNARFDDKSKCPTIKLLQDELVTQFKQKNLSNVMLKKNCRVMLIKNLNVDIGLINGSIGTVLEVRTSSVLVKFDNGITEDIGISEWTLEFNNIKSSAFQIPLILGYAFTSHRIQSLTLDSAIIDIGDAFCNHQVYVALSRLCTLNGLLLKTFNADKITVNERVLEYLNK